MTTQRFRLVAAAAAVLVLAVIVVTGGSLLPRDTAETVDDLAQLVGAVVATACCGWTGWRATGPERRWRLLVAAGIGSWGVGPQLAIRAPRRVGSSPAWRTGVTVALVTSRPAPAARAT